jgi:soluble lytic murein transglycosylase-like protein
MMAAESGFDARAQSPKGAIGLMQLMPATARALGVNPCIAHENIEGGVRYFAEMLWRFGSVELALIAYNGGPAYARRYARREVALYGETRDYVRTVLARAATGVS